MPLISGLRLGPYEVVAPLGAGGMGEVYRARDTRLGRDVAIKVLPSEVAADPERRARFEREARAVAALDHPHICAIYDVGEANGTHYLVMPLLDGQTLEARLAKGALPLDQGLAIAGQIADALDKAHRQGIVHRDLKPANVMLTKASAGSGGVPQAKLLDFGLAKLRAPGGPVTLSATGTAATAATGTAEGTILGTLHYMAPEQVEGKEADARSDIWALGAVLYEMVTGVRPFQGDTAASVIGSILKDQPPTLSSREPLSPPLFDRVVGRCLDKAPDRRWQSVADVGFALSLAGDPAYTPARSKPARASRALLLSTTAASLLGAAVMAPAWLSHSREAPPYVSRLAVLPPPDTKFSAPPASVVSPQIAMSPDGRLLAFVAQQGGSRPGLWVRPVDSLDARLLSGTEDATYPFWSPDSKSLGFFSRARLRIIDLAGGPSRALTDAPIDSLGGTWGRDGVILFTPGAVNVIFKVSASGGPATRVTQLDTSREETSHRFPSFLPDGRRFIYTVRSARSENWGISLASLEDPRGTVVTTGTDWSAQVVPPGYLFFMRGPALMVQEINLETGRLGGDPTIVAPSVGASTTAYASFSASQAGHLVYAPPPTLAGELRWFTRAGVAMSPVGTPDGFLDFALAPDERTLAVSRVDPQVNAADIWTVDLARGNQWSRLTNDRLNDASVLWSPDGTRVAFRSNRSGLNEIFLKRPSSGTLEERWLGVEQANLVGTDWSADGRYLVLTDASSPGGYTILAWDTSGRTRPEVIVRRPFNAMHGRLSPNGRWLAYTSDESGQWQVYLQPFPATSADDRKQVSFDGGVEPRWRQDGRELFFLGTDMRIMSVALPGGNVTQAETPQSLFQARVALISNQRTNYAVSRDGRRFLVNTSTGDGMAAPLSMVLNWRALLRQPPLK